MSAAPAIEVQNRQRRCRVDIGELRRFSECALQLVLNTPTKTKSQLRKLAAVSVVLIADPRMAILHRKFMNEKGATDVISFQHGDIFVSVETAQRNATRFGTTIEEEIALYIVHGLLHLHGFDDTTRAKARQMETVQKYIHIAALAAAGKR